MVQVINRVAGLRAGKAVIPLIMAVDAGRVTMTVTPDHPSLGPAHTETYAPDGTFDAIKVKRYVYAGDWDGFRQPTAITEIDWYAPALGRPVKSESKSEYIDTGRSKGKGG